MANTALNRSVVLLLTNKSGGGLNYGDTVILSSGTASAFTTTTSANQEDEVVGVILEPNGIANDAQGLVAISGYVPRINLAGSASLGDYVFTHTVAGQAQRSGTKGAGAFGRVLQTGTTPAAVLWGFPIQTASGGTDTAGAYIKLSHTETSGTNGGTFTSGSWQKRTINTEDSDAGGYASISSSVISLLAGTYRVEAEAVGNQVNWHQLRFRNTSDGTNAALGASVFSPATTPFGATLATCSGRFTIASTKNFELQHQCQTTRSTDGWGSGRAFGDGEVFATVRLIREP